MYVAVAKGNCYRNENSAPVFNSLLCLSLRRREGDVVKTPPTLREKRTMRKREDFSFFLSEVTTKK